MALIDIETMKKWPLAKVIRTFNACSSDLKKALKRYPKKMWGFSSKPGKNWSIQEVLWHLADSEIHASIRFRQALAEPNTTLVAWDQEKWGAAPPYRKLDAKNALEVFFALRKANIAFLKRVPKKAWGNKVRHPQYGVRTLEGLVVMNAWHVHNHIGQMERRFAEWKGRKA
jgi:hypothetical protein